MKKSSENFLNAIEEMEDSRGYQIDNQAFELENSFIMTVVNFGELKQLIEEVPVFNVEQKRKGESRKFQINALRLFVNYLASATAFKDHTRNFIRNIYGATDKAFNGKYQEKIDNEFKNDKLAQFIEDIRNFHQHYKPLPVSILSRIRNNTFYSRFVLSRDALLKSGYKNWKNGKRFLETEDENIDILQLAENYLYKTIFPWIMQQQAKYHQKEFKELERLKEKARKFYYDNKNR